MLAHPSSSTRHTPVLVLAVYTEVLAPTLPTVTSPLAMFTNFPDVANSLGHAQATNKSGLRVLTDVPPSLDHHRRATDLTRPPLLPMGTLVSPRTHFTKRQELVMLAMLHPL